MQSETYVDTVISLPESARAAFIRRTYLHLALAVAAFAGLEAICLNVVDEKYLLWLATRQAGWLIVLAAFMGVSWLAERWAGSATSKGTQYLGLGIYVAAEAIVFAPLLYIAKHFSKSPDLIPAAAILTGALFAGITAAAFMTQKDFSFLRSILTVGGFVALGLIAASLIFNFTLGIVFAGGMIVFASAAILYDTSNIIHRYRTDQHVAAALQLFASVALLFWYVIQFLRRYERS